MIINQINEITIVFFFKSFTRSKLILLEVDYKNAVRIAIIMFKEG